MRFHFFLFTLFIFLVGCETTIENRGHFINEDAIKKIKKHKSSKENVEEILGTPSLKGETIYKKQKIHTWYYISHKLENTSFYKSKTIEKDIFKIGFNANGTVILIDRITNFDDVILEPDDEQTKTTGYEENLSKSVLGTLERMFKSTPRKTKDQ